MYSYYTSRVIQIYHCHKKYTTEGIDFFAKAVLSRSTYGVNTFYFARQATEFINGSIGFESDKPITIYVKRTEAVITSEGAILKLKGPSIETLQFNPAVMAISSGTDFIEVQIPAGEIRF